MHRILLCLLLLVCQNIGANEPQKQRFPRPKSEQIEVVNIMHPLLQAYMEDSAYYFNASMDTSVIARYYQPEAGIRLDHPQGKRVEWHTTLSKQELKGILISLSETPDYEESQTFYPSSLTDTAYTIRNLFPYRLYYYKVEEMNSDSVFSTMTSGVFRTVGQVRMIRVDGARNVRDIGGWPTQFGIPIRYGLLYRSGRLDNVTPTGIHLFKENLGVRAELDLRSESKLKSSPLGKDVSFIRLVSDSYTGYLSKGKHRLGEDVTWIINRLREGKSVDWHCAVGCDRCGTLSFLIEGVLGVSEIDLCRDYELSCFAAHKRYRYHKGFRTMIPYIQRFGPANDLAECFFNYLIEAGVSKDDLLYLRSIMLDNNEPVAE